MGSRKARQCPLAVREEKNGGRDGGGEEGGHAGLSTAREGRAHRAVRTDTQHTAPSQPSQQCTGAQTDCQRGGGGGAAMPEREANKREEARTCTYTVGTVGRRWGHSVRRPQPWSRGK